MYIIVVLSLVPVFIWLYMEPLVSRFSDVSTITTSIGQIFGLIGIILFSINLILSSRFKFIDKYFGGLDKVYINHSKIGSIAFSMILLHPIFLVVKYIIISTQEAALFFIPFVDTPITWGIISLSLMIILISLTFYVKLKYHIWKFSHKFMIIAFFFGVIHTMLVSSDVSRNGLLRSYILLFAITGLIFSIRQAFLNKFIKKYKYKIKNINYLNKDILEIEMEPIDKKIVFTPGQFAFFSFINNTVSSESHPFSIASSCFDNNIKIAVKNFGDYTNSLKELRVNDSVLIDGPYGNFSYKISKNKNQIWIAGGIGITPFLSMSRNLEKDYNIDLFYSVKENNEAVYIKELEEISKDNPNFKFNLWTTSSFGFINADVISKTSNDFIGKDFFLCGPPIFMESLKDQLVDKGVSVNKIYYEKFNL